MSAPALPQKTITVSPKLEPLLRELRTFLRELPRLVVEEEEGRYALVKGDEVISVWDTYRDAAQVGQEKFGSEPFLIHQIHAHDVETFEGAELKIGEVCHPLLEKYKRKARS